MREAWPVREVADNCWILLAFVTGLLPLVCPGRDIGRECWFVYGNKSCVCVCV